MEVAIAVQRTRNHVLEDLSLTALKRALPPIWVVHPFHKDYGIDVQVEIFDNNGNTTGLRVYGQLKATDNSEEADVLSLGRDHFEYWAEHTDSVILFRFFAGSETIKWCWMHDLEWRMRPTAKSLDVSSYLRHWNDTDSASEIRCLAQLRADVLRNKLTTPISVLVKNIHASSRENFDFAIRMSNIFHVNLFEVISNTDSPCHFGIIIDNNKLCISHIGLQGYVATIDDVDNAEDIEDLAFLLLFLVANRYGRALVIRGMADGVMSRLQAATDSSLLPFIFEGLMVALGIDGAISQILKAPCCLENPALLFGLMFAGMRASRRLGEQESWLKQLKNWADAPPFQDMAGVAAYNYANNLANAGLGLWEEAEKYYLLAGGRDAQYLKRDYYWSELGAAQFEAAKYNAAIESYRQSFSISPKASTQWRLGDALFHNGNYYDAHTAIVKAVDSGERLGAYPLLVMSICQELLSRCLPPFNFLD
jgi:tetratricopeptide (TPR) repeat protein